MSADPALTAPAAQPDSQTTTARTRADEALFARLAAGDPRARRAIIERFLPLARSLARRYEHSGESLEDLVQVASLGLVKAVDGYDRAKGNSFSSYAVPSIVGELKRHFRDRTWIVRPPRALQELTLRVERATHDLWQHNGRAPTVAELAGALNCDQEQILETLQARLGRSRLSFDQDPGGDEEQPALQERIGTLDEGYDHADSRAALDRLLATLSPRSREILRLRFEQDMTQAEIGTLIGVSQMQISRIVRRALDALRYLAEQREHAQQRASSDPDTAAAQPIHGIAA